MLEQSEKHSTFFLEIKSSIILSDGRSSLKFASGIKPEEATTSGRDISARVKAGTPPRSCSLVPLSPGPYSLTAKQLRHKTRGPPVFCDSHTTTWHRTLIFPWRGSRALVLFSPGRPQVTTPRVRPAILSLRMVPFQYIVTFLKTRCSKKEKKEEKNLSVICHEFQLPKNFWFPFFFFPFCKKKKLAYLQVWRMWLTPRMTER